MEGAVKEVLTLSSGEPHATENIAKSDAQQIDRGESFVRELLADDHVRMTWMERAGQGLSAEHGSQSCRAGSTDTCQLSCRHC